MLKLKTLNVEMLNSELGSFFSDEFGRGAGGGMGGRGAVRGPMALIAFI